MLGVSHQTLNNLRWNGSGHMSLFKVFISQTLYKSLWTSKSVRILEVLFDISLSFMSSQFPIHPSSKLRIDASLLNINVCQFPPLSSVLYVLLPHSLEELMLDHGGNHIEYKFVLLSVTCNSFQTVSGRISSQISSSQLRQPCSLFAAVT